MNTEKHLSSSRWHYLKEALLTALVGGMPLFIGRRLRRVLYKAMVAKLGTGVDIYTGVELVNANNIEIGNGVRIDRDVRIRNVSQDGKIRIGNWARLSRGADIKLHSGGDGYIEIGDYTTVGPYSCLTGRDIKVGKYCLIAPHVGIFANNHVFEDPTQYIMHQGHTYQGIVIEDDCWLGSGVKVLDGVTIGKGSVIGAGAVVTKNIPPYSVAVGVPAKVVAKRSGVHSKAELNLIHQ